MASGAAFHALAHGQVRDQHSLLCNRKSYFGMLIAPQPYVWTFPLTTGSSAAPEQRQAPQKQRTQAEEFPTLGKAASSLGRPPAPQPAASVSDSAKAANKVAPSCGRLR